MREIYNEGRVVGLSAYESYIRQLLSINPYATPLTEREWLSATFSSNVSMILRIPAGTEQGIHDYILPEGSDLCGCSTIYGSIFEGSVTTPETINDHDRNGTIIHHDIDTIPARSAVDTSWALRVDDYGRLISNTYTRHPETPGTSEYVPAKADVTIGEEYANQCREYAKVTGALMFQPGTWTSNIYFKALLVDSQEFLFNEDYMKIYVPVKDTVAIMAVEPDFSQRGFVRLVMDADIEHDFYILFKGFAYKSIANGEVGYSQLKSKGHPEDGDFLGPAAYPWACSIVMITSNDVMSVLMKDLNDKIDALVNRESNNG